jgi:putative phage-type endonuclease
MLTLEQIKLRKNGIGGSDAAVVCGLSPYKTPRELWFEKLSDEICEIDNEFIRIGNYFEPFIIKEFERNTELKVSQPSNTFYHEKYKFLIAHVDGIIDQTGEIFEAKTCLSYHNAKKFGDEGTDQMPTEYLMQCVHYAAVLDRPVVILAALVLGKLKIYKYERNAVLESKYIEKASEFWDMVQNKTMPEAVNFTEALKEYHANDDESLFDEEAMNLVNELRQEKERIKSAEEKCDALKLSLIKKMGTASKLIDSCGGTLARVIEKSRASLDKNLLKAANIDIAPYYKQTAYKELRTF